MTKNLFRYYAMRFVAELSLIRLQYPKRLREEPVVLFVDGHPRRWDFKACLILWHFNVDCVTFSGHITPVTNVRRVSGRPSEARVQKAGSVGKL